jgi:ferredoxin
VTINTLDLIYFSPTRGTQKVLLALSQGMAIETIRHYDLTAPEAESQPLTEIAADLAVLGVPVYAGRVPVEAARRIRQLKSQGTPAVILAVYGNRDFDDALLELRDLALEQGFQPFAAAAFIAEHSYSTDKTPIAVGRPDEADQEKARQFGRQILEKLNHSSGDSLSLVQVPGKFPYKERVPRPEEMPLTKEDLCTLCGTCASVCPTAAVIVGETVVTAGGRCIICQACVKNCPTGARVMEVERVQKIAQWLTANCSQRKEPVIFP